MYQEESANIKYTENAFINPEARLSRDISVAFLSSVGKQKNLLDATSATGIRGIRYIKEAKVGNVTFLEINEKAFKTLKKNVQHNLKNKKNKVLNESLQEVANLYEDKFDVIDIDPFGTAAPYIYDAMKIAKGNTFLMVTATDLAVLCGANERACIKMYDSRPIHNELCHEAATRILIAYIIRIAAQFNFGVEVYYTLSYRHYIRLFLRLKHGADEAVSSVKNLGYLNYCHKCMNFSFDRSFFPNIKICSYCKNKYEVYGKMWIGSLFKKETQNDIAEYFKKHEMPENEISFINTISNEIDTPFYYVVPRISHRLKMQSISFYDVMEKLKEKGYAVSTTHFKKESIKTNAKTKEVIDCIKNLSK